MKAMDKRNTSAMTNLSQLTAPTSADFDHHRSTRETTWLRGKQMLRRQDVALTFPKNYAVKQHCSIYKRYSFVCRTYNEFRLTRINISE
jgi:hypothetical protein